MIKNYENGKLVVFPHKLNANQYEIRWDGNRGEIPDVCKGMFSTKRRASLAIDVYNNLHIPEPINYTGQKKITDEEEAAMFAEVQKKVKAINDGKAKKSKKKK
jgi:ribosomal protein L31